MKLMRGAWYAIFILVCVGAADTLGDTLTGGLWGVPDGLEKKGILVDMGITNIYQLNLQGGINTNQQRGRYTGSYDVELTADLERYFGISGASFFIHAEGSWPGDSVDDVSIESFFGVNGDAGDHRRFDITEAYWEQGLWDNTLMFRIGKLDITGGFECSGCPVSFDGNQYANDETTQFLNGALVNNPTIPFPAYALAAVVHWNPIEDWYASFGMADSQGDYRRTGFQTAFDGRDYYLYIVETGVTPRMQSANGDLPGAYRFGMWYQPEPKSVTGGSDVHTDDTGFYASFDQLLYRESGAENDMQGLGGFFRYGFAREQANDLNHFVSFGVQYEGLFEGREEDVLGFGCAYGIFSDEASNTYTDDFENAVELYYNVKITPWMQLSPSIQYVTNPNGNRSTSDALVAGMRTQIVF